MQKINKKLKKFKTIASKGFSLVELLVVVAIIGVLAAVGVVGYDRYVENTKSKVFYQNADTVLKAMDFEFIVAANNLSSTLNEVNSSGVATGNKVSQSSTCETFLYSVKEHFKHFKNPWHPTKAMVSVDSQTFRLHAKGTLQVTCARAPWIGSGWNCPLDKSLWHLMMYNVDGGGFATGGPGGAWDYANPIARLRVVNDIKTMLYYTRGDGRPKSVEEGGYGGTNPWYTWNQSQLICGSTGFYNASLPLSSDAQPFDGVYYDTIGY